MLKYDIWIMLEDLLLLDVINGVFFRLGVDEIYNWVGFF